MDFETLTVEELINENILEKPMDGNHGSIHPKGSDFKESGIPFITAADINNGEVDLVNCKFISRDQAIRLKKGFSRPGDVLLTHKASVGRTAIVPNMKYEFIVLSPQVTYYRMKEGESLLPYYLYIYFSSPIFYRIINQYAGGSTRNYIGITAQKKLPIMIPNKKNQLMLINVLKSINVKIRLNQNTIANLEELSQTLFKRWFLDFEFPDENGNPYKSNGGLMINNSYGTMPKEWELKCLDEIANFTNGLAMQKYKPSIGEDPLPIVKIKELKAGFIDDNSGVCTPQIPHKAVIEDGDIIFSWSATLMVRMWAGGKAGLNQHLFKVTSEKYPSWLYYSWVNYHIKQFRNIAEDKATTMGHINRKHLSEAKVLIPDENSFKIMDGHMKSYFEQMLSMNLQNRYLIELRDTLLPKLMSGEIELPDTLEVTEDAEFLQRG
ncbi:restriction endonuclease subunit S [Salinicoccus roseus]|uniref:restriction endonuclease subunit S n=1 Tax=Salinicoccus roseus TaxID=45670 RepID=UPI001EF6DA6F|nr:restriction endonuclease subunit S [Salinicoccus roseus]MCG7331860.1 restriction endonuclease subunit S [Salinicoccus roseus]